MANEVDYRETAPPPRLAAAIECVWERTLERAEVTVAPLRVAPDNCVDVIVLLSPDQRELLTLHAVGPMTHAHPIQPRHAVRYLGIRFNPGWACTIFGIDAAELRDESVSLGDLSPSLDRLIRDCLTTARRADAVSHALAVIARTLDVRTPPPPFVREAIDRIGVTRGALDVGSLSRTIAVSRQHLARAFQRHVGLSPKFVARVARVRYAGELAHRSARPAWSRIAAECGYADQSHLVADFRALLGAPPTSWMTTA